MAEKPNILIAVPAYRNNVRAECMSSLVQLGATLTTRGVEQNVLAGDFGDIEQARNFFGSFLLHQTNCTHLLMSDDDIRFQPSAVIKMIELNKPVVACAVPRRGFTNPPKFNLMGLKSDSTVTRIGTALMLIQRTALERMARHESVRTRLKHPLIERKYTKPMHGFFDRMEDGDFLLSEDYSFCDRWTSMGGKIHAILDEAIGHIDAMLITGSFSDHTQLNPPVSAN